MPLTPKHGSRHQHHCASPDRAALETPTLTAHVGPLRHSKEVSIRFFIWP